MILASAEYRGKRLSALKHRGFTTVCYIWPPTNCVRVLKWCANRYDQLMLVIRSTDRRRLVYTHAFNRGVSRVWRTAQKVILAKWRTSNNGHKFNQWKALDIRKDRLRRISLYSVVKVRGARGETQPPAPIWAPCNSEPPWLNL